MTTESRLLKQPARFLLIHLTSEFDSTSGIKLTQTLERFFSLVCNLEGASRLLYFGLVTFGSAYKILLPLQAIRGNFIKVVLSLSKLRWQLQKSSCEYASNVSEAILNCIGMFDRLVHNFHKTSIPHLELTIISMQTDSRRLKKEIREVSKRVSFQHIQKIQVVFLRSDSGLTGVLKYGDGGDGGGDGEEGWDVGEDGGGVREDGGGDGEDGGDEEKENALDGFIEAVTLETRSLHSLLMGWLRMCEAEEEFIAISFASGLSIKCDVQERFINPLHLPSSLHHSFDLSIANNPLKIPSPHSSITSKNCMTNLKRNEGEDGGSVHCLEVVKVMAMNRICESLLFGNPLVLRATSCWKLDWEELEDNCQHFQALCHLLAHKEQALLVVERIRQHDSPNHLTPHYIIMPSSSCLLVKAITTSELLLPIHLPPSHSPSNLPCLSAVQSQLEQVFSAGALFAGDGRESGYIQSITDPIKPLDPLSKPQQPTSKEECRSTKDPQLH